MPSLAVMLNFFTFLLSIGSRSTEVGINDAILEVFYIFLFVSGIFSDLRLGLGWMFLTALFSMVLFASFLKSVMDLPTKDTEPPYKRLLERLIIAPSYDVSLYLFFLGQEVNLSLCKSSSNLLVPFVNGLKHCR